MVVVMGGDMATTHDIMSSTEIVHDFDESHNF